MKGDLTFSSLTLPKVLFLGNGILRLSQGCSWDGLLQGTDQANQEKINLDNVPYAMRPEALYGVNVEEVQRKTAKATKDLQIEENSMMDQITGLPFDAILTTNYTYEIESVLTGKVWTDRDRKKAFRALDGSSHVRHNTSICNYVQAKDGRMIPVFHIHGERLRVHSLVLCYYSYANAVSKLIALNKQRSDDYLIKQNQGNPIIVKSWLDYYIMGEVYAIGFGFDPSEFDVWWAIERKAREQAKHGKLHAIMTEDEMDKKPQKVLFDSMEVDLHNYEPQKDKYEGAYEAILQYLRKEMLS